MFGRSKEDKDRLFEDLCLVMLHRYYGSPRRINKEDMFEICEKAEELEEIIRN